MERNMQLQSKQLNKESTDPENDSCTSTDDDFVDECFSVDNSMHAPAPLESPRVGKRLLEEEMVESERKKLYLMQSAGDRR
jgi:hypothetical protein